MALSKEGTDSGSNWAYGCEIKVREVSCAQKWLYTHQHILEFLRLCKRQTFVSIRWFSHIIRIVNWWVKICFSFFFFENLNEQGIRVLVIWTHSKYYGHWLISYPIPIACTMQTINLYLKVSFWLDLFFFLDYQGLLHLSTNVQRSIENVYYKHF